MGIAETIFSAIFNVLNIYIEFRVICFFCTKKESPILPPMVVYVCVWTLNWGIYYWIGNPDLTTFSLLIGLLSAASVLYEGSFLRKIVSVVSALVLGIIIEELTWKFLGGYEIVKNNEAFGSLLSSLVFMMLVLVLEKLFTFDKRNKISTRSYLNIIIVLLGSAVVAEILVSLGDGERNLTMIGLSVICLMDVSTFYLYDKINEVYVQRLERKTIEERILMYENQFALLEQSQKNIQALRHDMKNHFLLLKSYLDSGQYENARIFLKEISSYMDISGQYVKTGNQEIDTVLNYMIGRAEGMSCRVETDIQVPESCFMSKFDLNVLLSNLLDNALEALERAEDKYLYISLKYRKGILIVRIYNSFDGKLRKKGKRYLTSKQDKESHGMGLQNVLEIIEKYDGEKNIQTANQLFKVDIILYITAKQ